MTPSPPQLPIEASTRALLDLVETDRARQCTQILGDENARASALRSQAHREACLRMRQAFEEQRALRRERIAAAHARLATQRRLHEQQRSAALLQLAWQQLPGELRSRWQQADTRAAWVAHVVAAAQGRMPQGAWCIVHGPDWPEAARQALAATLRVQPDAAPVCESDASISSGLKIVAQGNVIDGTLEGLLADRAELDARLLRQLEARS